MDAGSDVPNHSFRRSSAWLLAALSVLLAFLLLSACQRRVAVSASSGGAASSEVVLVLPFQNMAERFPDAAAVRSPVSGKVFPVGEVAEGAETMLTEQVVALLKGLETHRVLLPGRARAALSRLALANEDLVSDREMMVRIGAMTGAGAVLGGFVYRFRERVGAPYGVTTPASVAFDLHLIQVATGRRLWSAAFDETQQSLSENLLAVDKFISRKGKWVTAGAMAEGALKEAFKTFP